MTKAVFSFEFPTLNDITDKRNLNINLKIIL